MNADWPIFVYWAKFQCATHTQLHTATLSRGNASRKIAGVTSVLATSITKCIGHRATTSVSLFIYMGDLLHLRSYRAISESSVAFRSNLPMMRIELIKRSFCIAAPTVWNTLPTKLRLCNSVSTYRPIANRLKCNFLLRRIRIVQRPTNVFALSDFARLYQSDYCTAQY